MKSKPLNAAALLDDNGPFAHQQPGFRARHSQQVMANAVQHALQQQETLVVEAGTGVGKTFAYLVPALLSPHQVIISTGTKNLQDQLYKKDLPLAKKALGLTTETALLKGRRNYLCLYRLQQLMQQEQFAFAQQSYLRDIQRWRCTTKTGDIAELSGIAEDAPIWSSVTSTTENCLGMQCPDYEDCFVVWARRRVHEAKIVVINHYVLFADMALKDDELGELLPHVGAFILDEAHQLPDIASQFFADTLSSWQLMELSRDTLAEQARDAPDMGRLAKLAKNLPTAVENLRGALGDKMLRGHWSKIASEPNIMRSGGDLYQLLDELSGELSNAAERGRGLEQCSKRALAHKNFLESLYRPLAGNTYWFEISGRLGFALHATPIDVAPSFAAYREHTDAAWIFTSATLSVGEDFGHFCHRLGLHDTQCLQLSSPFDYQRNARLYCPPNMPDPSSREYTPAVVEAILPLVTHNPGGSFLLFTSHRALREAAQLLHQRTDRLILVQGQASRGELVEQFRAAGNAILLGAQSFWEGVDVRGHALSCVVIDKLPFAVPDDPVLEARLALLREKGENPFMNYQLPQAILSLKQGVGRLIRDVSDRGLLVICDPRLHTKRYGHTFLQSLPPIPISRDLDQALAFLCHRNR